MLNKGIPYLSLFSGAGGLDLGLERAGFSPALCVENDEDSRQTIELNRPAWKLANPGDIHSLTGSQIIKQLGIKRRKLPLLVGGPPCQPFSKSGYWSSGDSLRLLDPRSKTIQAFLNAVEITLPKIVLLENVKGILYNKKDEGLRLIQSAFKEINKRNQTEYIPYVFTLNSAEFGIPQMRERVFVVANIDGKTFFPPLPTHGPESVGKNDFLTAWDAIGIYDKDNWPNELNLSGRWAKLIPSIPEGYNYLWHTQRNGGEPLFGWRTRYWSFLLKLAKNRPAWTIQAEPGPATGPFHWKNRLLSIQELCALQTFPKNYKISGNRRSAVRQIGNAVPVALGELLGLSIKNQFFNYDIGIKLTSLPKRRRDCPTSERTSKVPAEYLKLRGKHSDHPGVGLGPGILKREIRRSTENDK
ncbi:DNA cytosine methyltransferase [Leptospira interrogans]|uniref:DNA cytosine methyltransferase n=1 Tax=Leptospira interrogans TaxID=173 RepID=UPI0007738592|nr:DNA cytosine methyltransferase [Leptospira interrogans]